MKTIINRLATQTSATIKNLLQKSSEKFSQKKANSSTQETKRPFSLKGSKSSGEDLSSKIKDKISAMQPMTLFFSLIRSIYAPDVRTRVHKTFVFVFAAALAFSFAKLIAMMLAGPPKQTIVSGAPPIAPYINYKSQLADIKKHNIFNARENEKDKLDRLQGSKKNVACEKSEIQSDLPLKLTQALVMQNRKKSMVNIQINNGDLLPFREGDDINGMAKVTKIDRKKTLLRNINNGQCEFIAIAEEKENNMFKKAKVFSAAAGAKLMNSGSGPIQSEGNKLKIQKSFRDDILKDMNTILTQAKAIPMTNPDGSMSFKLTEIVPGSVYSKLNLQNDDIITGIDGKKIDNLNQVMTMLGKIREIDNLQLTIKRDGNDENLDFHFE